MVYAENFNIEQYGKCQLSAHDIFWVKRDGSRVLVCRAGEYLDQESLSRYPKLDFEIKTDSLKVSGIKEILLNLKSGMRPREKIKLSNKVRELWREWFFSTNSLTPLEVMIVGDELMHESYQDLVKAWSQPSTMLFQRSCLIASLSVLGAISLGYTSWPYLENLWLVNFTYSAHFSETGMKFTDLDDLENSKNRNKKNNVNFNKFSNKFVSLDFMSSLIFEKADGSGLPQNIKLNDLSDIERWFNYLHQTLPWNKSIVEKDNQFWKDVWSEDSFSIISKLQNTSSLEISSKKEYIEFEL